MGKVEAITKLLTDDLRASDIAEATPEQLAKLLLMFGVWTDFIKTEVASDPN